jgi:hypothetical protein
VVEKGTIVSVRPAMDRCVNYLPIGANRRTMRSVLRTYLTPEVVLTAILIGFSLGLLFEGFMIGPEYRREKPPILILMVLVLEGAFIAFLWMREKNKR